MNVWYPDDPPRESARDYLLIVMGAVAGVVGVLIALALTFIAGGPTK